MCVCGCVCVPDQQLSWCSLVGRDRSLCVSVGVGVGVCPDRRVALVQSGRQGSFSVCCVCGCGCVPDR